MVAVGLSPRTESKHTIRRRVATAELSTGTKVFNRRDATRDNVVWSLRGLKPTAIPSRPRSARPGRLPAWYLYNEASPQTDELRTVCENSAHLSSSLPV